SGVEGGGGEPSSGDTPDKKTPPALTDGAVMALISNCPRHHRRKAPCDASEQIISDHSRKTRIEFKNSRDFSPVLIVGPKTSPRSVSIDHFASRLGLRRPILARLRFVRLLLPIEFDASR